MSVTTPKMYAKILKIRYAWIGYVVVLQIRSGIAMAGTQIASDSSTCSSKDLHKYFVLLGYKDRSRR